jgi:two-component system sensor kinase FixL
VPSQQIDREVKVWLERLGRRVGVERISLQECGRLSSGFIYLGPGSAPLSERGGSYPWLKQQYLAGKTVAWRRIPTDIPPEASIERAEALRVGAKSLLGIPLPGANFNCSITFVACRQGNLWRRGLVRRLRLAGEILASAIARGHAQQALDANQTSHSALLRAMPDTVYVFGRDGTYLDFCRRDSRATILPPRDLIGQRSADILPRHLANTLNGAFTRAGQTRQRVDLEYDVPRGGVMRHFEAHVVDRDDGAFVCLERDVTEQKKLERHLRNKFDVAFDDAPVGMALVSPEGRWLRANLPLERMLGYSRDELYGLAVQDLIRPQDISPNVREMKRALAGDITRYEGQVRLTHKDGRTFPVLVCSMLVRDPEESPLYFILHLQDLTALENARAEQDRLRVELAYAGRIELSHHLAASLAHQLLQSITAIVTNVEAGQHALELAVPNTATLSEALQDILTCGKNAAAVIEHTTRFLRKEPHRVQRVDLHRLVLEVISWTSNHMLLAQVQHSVALEASAADVLADPLQLKQVILNLIVNATAASQICPPSERILRITTRDVETDIELTVYDRGPAASPQQLQKLSEPYSQGWYPTGMGLYFAAEIIRAHGGRVWAEKNAGAGLTQHCLLPRAHL